MIDSLWPFLQEQLKDNHFLAGGGILMVLGGIAAYLRNLPDRLWRWVLSQFVIEVDVNDQDPAFVWVAEWLAAQPYSQNRARRLRITTLHSPPGGQLPQSDNPGETAKPRIVLTPSAGRHYFFYRNRLVVLIRAKESPGENQSTRGFSKESFTLRMFTRQRGVMQALLNEARTFSEPPEDDRTNILTYRKYQTWVSTLKRRPRNLESVILAHGVMEELATDVASFLADEEWYIKRGIPYRRSYLLYGPPGSGKTSAVLALASKFKHSIATVNLAEKELTDDELRDRLSEMPLNAFGLIEDIDCLFMARAATDENPSCVTFAGLLNALDGVASVDGRVMFITTNHRDKLDAALLRPARCDVQVEIGNADKSQICRIFDKFFPEAEPSQVMAFVDQIPSGKVSMSAIQGLLSKYKSDIDGAIKHAEELCTS